MLKQRAAQFAIERSGRVLQACLADRVIAVFFLTSVCLHLFYSHVGFQYCGCLQLQECAICHNNIKSACSGTPCGSTYVSSNFSTRKYSGFWFLVFRIPCFGFSDSGFKFSGLILGFPIQDSSFWV